MTHQLLFLMISQNHYLIILNNYLRKSLTLYRRLSREIVTSEMSYLGGEGNLLHPDETALQRIQLKKPVITEAQLASIDSSCFNVTHLSTVYTGSLKVH